MPDEEIPEDVPYEGPEAPPDSFDAQTWVPEVVSNWTNGMGEPVEGGLSASLSVDGTGTKEFVPLRPVTPTTAGTKEKVTRGDDDA